MGTSAPGAGFEPDLTPVEIAVLPVADKSESPHQPHVRPLRQPDPARGLQGPVPARAPAAVELPAALQHRARPTRSRSSGSTRATATRELVMARWGLIPCWMKEKPKIPHINARAETVHKLPLFREAFAKRRALIPATGFFEWQKRADGKQPYRFVPEGPRALRLRRAVGVRPPRRRGDRLRRDHRRRAEPARRRRSTTACR